MAQPMSEYDGFCFACSKPGMKHACSGCGTATYCNGECQKRDWKVHKAVCGEMKTRRVFAQVCMKKIVESLTQRAQEDPSVVPTTGVIYIHTTQTPIPDLEDFSNDPAHFLSVFAQTVASGLTKNRMYDMSVSMPPCSESLATDCSPGIMLLCGPVLCSAKILPGNQSRVFGDIITMRFVA